MHKLERDKILDFLLAGKAIFTVRNEETGNRFTYRVKRFERKYKKDLYFVKVLTGADNESYFSYTFIGTIFPEGYFKHSPKSRISQNAQSVKVFAWLWKVLRADKLPECVNVYHEGRCGRCGRRLTVPESVLSGYGPECVKRITRIAA
jgi:hypothetical protein